MNSSDFLLKAVIAELTQNLRILRLNRKAEPFESGGANQLQFLLSSFL